MNETKFIIDAERSGLASAFGSTTSHVIQKGLSPTIIEDNKTSTNNADKITKESQVDTDDVVEIVEVPIAVTAEDELANEYVKNLTERGLVIKNSIVHKVHSTNDPDVYYDVVSRLGDNFLIKLPLHDKTDSIYYKSTNAEKSQGRVISASEGQVMPIRGNQPESCASDPVCANVFRCDAGTKGACYPSGQSSRVVEIERCVEKNDVTMKHSGMSIACPVYEYLEFIGNPRGVTEEVAEKSIQIAQRAVASNIQVIKSMSDRTKQFNDIMNSLSVNVASGADEIVKNRDESFRIAKQWEDQGGPQTKEDKEKYEKLVSLRMTYSSIASNVVDMSNSIYSTMDLLHSMKKDAIVKLVKLWVQGKLRLSNSIKTSILPEGIEKLQGEDLNDIFSGNIKLLDNAIRAFKSTDLETLYTKLMGKTVNLTDENIVQEVKNMGAKINESLLDSSLGENDIKLAYQIVAINVIYETVEDIYPNISKRNSQLKDIATCEDGKVCPNVDKDGKLTYQANGNLGALGSYTNVAGATSAYSNAIERLL